jgi:hypothetical protein
MKLLVMYFSPVSCCFLPFRTKYLPQLPDVHFVSLFIVNGFEVTQCSRKQNVSCNRLYGYIYIYVYICVKKVKSSLEQAMKAQRGS